jgi:O-antigen/teichoic acid export membrane protein
VRSATSTYATNIGVALFSFVSVLITARVLGADGRGSIAFLTTVAFLTSQVATLGIFQADANFAAREPRLTPSLAGTSAAMAAIFGLVGAVVVALIIAIFPAAGAGSAPALIALVLAVIPVLVLQPCLDQLLRAHYVFTLANAAWLGARVVNVVINGTLALIGALTVGTAVASWIAGEVLGTLLLTWGVVHHVGGFSRPDPALARRMLGFGLKAYAGRVMLLGNYRLDQWLLGAIAGARELGLYSVAVAWVEALFFLPTALSLVQRPDLVRASRPEAERQAAMVFRGAAMITLLLAAAMVVGAPFLCVTIFGDQFEGSIEMLRLLAAGAFGIVALKLLGNALTAQRKPMLETAAVATAFVFTVALDLILIPPHGGVGAAIASSAAYTVGGVAVAVIFARALDGRVRDLIPRGRELVWLARRLRSRAAAAEGPG